MAARRRVIDPSIWDDEDVGSLSDGAFRLFVGCFSNADDYGKLEGSARRLRGIVFRFRDDVSIAQVEEYLAEIEQTVRSFHRYELDGRQYIAFLKWNVWQTFDHPQESRIPDPPGVTFAERSPKVRRKVSEDSPNNPGTFAPNRINRREKNLNSPPTPQKGEPAGNNPDRYRFLASKFQRYFPSQKQGPVKTTAALMAEKYAAYTLLEVENRLEAHHAAETKDLAPWELFIREPGSNASPPEVRHRTTDEQLFYEVHGHYPDEPCKECSACQETAASKVS